MLLATISDPHVGNFKRFGGEVVGGLNERCRHTLHTLEQAVDVASTADVLVVNGDLADYCGLEPQVEARLREILSRVPCYLLVGNHDQNSDQPGDHALGPLASATCVVVEKPQLVTSKGVELLLVPFQRGPAHEWLPQVLSAFPVRLQTSRARVLHVHLGIADGKTAPFLANAHDSIGAETLRELMEKHDIDYTCAGNWHDPRTWTFGQRQIFQVGALCPTGFDNQGDEYGCVRFLGLSVPGSHTTFVRDVGGPRFYKLTLEEVQEKVAQAGDGFSGAKAFPTYLLLRCAPDREAQQKARAALASLIEQGLVVDGDIEPDQTQARDAARAAAQAARNEDTLDGSLASFIEAMPVPDGVARAVVRARALEFLAKGGGT